MTARTSPCSRCKAPTLSGVRCHRCTLDSAVALELAEGMRRFADVLVWFVADAWFRRENGAEGRASMLAVILADHRRRAA